MNRLPSCWGLLFVGMGLMLPVAANAHEQCDESLTYVIREAQRKVDALHPTDPGQIRVTANEGAESVADNVRSMQYELQMIGEACARGGDVEAAWRLEKLQEILVAVRRSRPSGN